jgi:hypothetical protein
MALCPAALHEQGSELPLLVEMELGVCRTLGVSRAGRKSR